MVNVEFLTSYELMYLMYVYMKCDPWVFRSELFFVRYIADKKITQTNYVGTSWQTVAHTIVTSVTLSVYE